MNDRVDGGLSISVGDCFQIREDTWLDNDNKQWCKCMKGDILICLESEKQDREVSERDIKLITFFHPNYGLLHVRVFVMNDDWSPYYLSKLHDRNIDE